MLILSRKDKAQKIFSGLITTHGVSALITSFSLKQSSEDSQMQRTITSFSKIYALPIGVSRCMAVPQLLY